MDVRSPAESDALCWPEVCARFWSHGLAGIPKYWTECRKRYLADNDMLTRFLNRNAELMNRKTGYMERQETLDEEFGVTYAVLRPYIEEWQAQQDAKKAKRAAGTAKAEPEPVVPEAVEVTAVEAEKSLEQIEGHGDLEDVRWALSNLSRQDAKPSQAPSQIGWNLLVIARSGVQGQLKLLDIYRATIIQPTAKAREAEMGRTDADDAHLKDLMGRLGEGLDSDGGEAESGVASAGVSGGAEIQG